MPTLRIRTALFAAVTTFAAVDALAFDTDAVRREVDDMNRSLPTMVSPVLREEPIRFGGNTLTYTFTHVGRTADDIARQNLDVTARAYLLRQLCNDADARQLMREGVTYAFSYVDESQRQHNDTVLTDRDCAAREPR